MAQISRTEHVRKTYPHIIKSLFGRDQKDLCPFVQSILTDYGPDGEGTKKAFSELQKHFTEISTPTPDNPTPSYVVRSTGRPVKYSFKDAGMIPEPGDIARFFVNFARGAQFIADEHGANPLIKKIMVVQPELFEKIRGRKAVNPRDHAMSYIVRSMYKPHENSPPIENTLLISTPFLYEAVAAWARGFLIRHEGSKVGMILGHLDRDDYLATGGIEECDHAHWIAHPEAFHEKFGLTLEDYIKSLDQTKPAKYDEDPLEVHANEMKLKARKPLEITSHQLGF